MHPLINRRSILLLPMAAHAAQKSEVWRFNRLDRVGKHSTTVLGNPRVISTSKGKAVQFDGDDDALFIDNHPLAGASTFTWEVVFRPDSGGRPEQRFFHLQEDGSQHRLLLETRLMGNQWCLDSFAASKTGQKALMDRKLLHALDQWHHVAFVYDGNEMRHYVNHQLELSAKIELAPQGPGKSSVGVRFTKVDYFKGAIRLAVFTRSPLSVSKFQSW